MDRAERLLDLVTFLLDADRPVPFRDLRDAFEDYAGASREAAQRKFERDKAALLELGIPLEYREPTEDGEEGGYWIDRDLYYLPRLMLEPEELALLYVSGSAALEMEGFPWPAEVRRALEKIRFAAEESGTAPAPFARQIAIRAPRQPEAVGRTFSVLRDAIQRNKRVTLVYHSMYRNERNTREVDPYGLFLREGVWCLYGYCHLRKGERTFHLDRIESVSVNPNRPRSPDFEPPPDLDLMAHARMRPWEFPIEDPVEVTVRLSPHLAFSAQTLFGPAARIRENDDGSAEARVVARHLDALLSHLLSLKGGVEVMGPASVREEMVRRLDGVIRGHT